MCAPFELSERRACRIIGCVRMTVRYHSRRPRDTELRERLRALAHSAIVSATGGSACCCDGRASL
jgi:hypothetical protein